MTAWSELRGQSIWFDETRQQWRYMDGQAVTDFHSSRDDFWDIQWAPNPWFSLGIHIDHRDPYIAIHLPGVVIGIGNMGYPGFGRGIRTGKVY